ncbi:MAG: hypothetical protein PHF44_03765 [Candidatus Pacebacteria bacterium]|nr:hypothetical protein [Candidatus Paceibacterota bacterium]
MAKEQVYFIVVLLIISVCLLFVFLVESKIILRNNNSESIKINQTESPIEKEPELSSQILISDIDGEIKRISDTGLFIDIKHQYFNDSQSRELEVVFGDNTEVFSGDKSISKGKDSIKNFKEGYRIHVKTSDNIFEKSKVKADEIRILSMP